MKPYVMTGTLLDEKTVTLDKALPMQPRRVRLILEPLWNEPQKSYQEVLARIRQRQLARGHQARTREEVDAYLKSERESWG